MSRALKPASEATVMMVRGALADLRRARYSLRLAGADKAADYVARSIKSAEGALNHARRRAAGAR